MKVVVLAASAALVAAGSAECADLKVYGQLPAVEQAALSPDGRQVALITTDGAQRSLVVEDFETLKGSAKVYGPLKVRSLEWADDANLLLGVSTTVFVPDYFVNQLESNLYFVIDAKTKQEWPLINSRNLNFQMARSKAEVRRVDGKTYVLVETLAFDGNSTDTAPAVMQVDVATKGVRAVAKGSPYTLHWVLGASGLPLAELRYRNGRNGGSNAQLLARQDQTFLPLAPPSGADADLELLGRGQGGDAILVGYTKDGAYHVAEYDVGKRAWGPDLDERCAFGGFEAETQPAPPSRQASCGADEAARTEWDRIQALFPDSLVEVASRSSDHKRLLVKVDSPTAGMSFAAVDLAAGSVRTIGAEYPGLTPADIGPVRTLHYKAADGTPIEGYLTLPPGKADAKGLPLVALVHGGPAVRDEPGFDWWSQALAAQGYAVMRVNYRGSGGYGLAFQRAGYGEWGKKMQTDVSDGVRYLAGEGVIDPKRVCVVGASYGGYAALAGATLDKGVYRCAADVEGVSDLRAFIHYALQKNPDGAAQWIEMTGARDDGDKMLDAISPALLADRVEIPILLVHGKKDTVVPYDQSTRMANALKKAGKPYELVTLDGEDHWLSSGATRLKMLQAVTTFLLRNNPPG